MKIKTVIKAFALLSISSSAFASVVVNQAVTEDEVLAAQHGWCQALVDISTTYTENGHEAAKTLAQEVIEGAYAYQMGTVLFKPTLTVNPQTFRTTPEGALSYFVGGDETYPQDTGFALKNWTKCEIDNAGVFITGNSASTMGKVHFTDVEGNQTSVDKTWKFVKDDTGAMRIALHHSSLEYTEE